jgi:hypothetical protein
MNDPTVVKKIQHSKVFRVMQANTNATVIGLIFFGIIVGICLTVY